MGYRRQAREFALQMLFHLDVNKDQPDWREEFWTLHPAPREVRQFADLLVEGVLSRHGVIDALIGKHALNWSLSRMSIVDRNILRSALFEMLFYGETPFNVVLNEAIEIAKRFSDEQAAGFINGILDSILKEGALADRGSR